MNTKIIYLYIERSIPCDEDYFIHIPRHVFLLVLVSCLLTANSQFFSMATWTQ